MSITHELKTDPAVFQAVWDGRKPFEIRFNDRDFKEGDTLLLRETKYSGRQMQEEIPSPLKYTGRTLTKEVAYILYGPIYGLQEGWVIIGFALQQREQAHEAQVTSLVAEKNDLARMLEEAREDVRRLDWLESDIGFPVMINITMEQCILRGCKKANRTLRDAITQAMKEAE